MLLRSQDNVDIPAIAREAVEDFQSFFRILTKVRRDFHLPAGEVDSHNSPSSCSPMLRVRQARFSCLHPSLMSAGYPHILAILGNGATGHADTVLAQACRDVLIRKRLGGIFFLNHFLDQSLQIDQRGFAPRWSLDG